MPGFSRSTAPKDRDLDGLVAREGKDLVGQVVPVRPTARDGPKSGREEGAWAVEVQVEEADAHPAVIPHRGCAEKARANPIRSSSQCPSTSSGRTYST